MIAVAQQQEESSLGTGPNQLVRIRDSFVDPVRVSLFFGRP